MPQLEVLLKDSRGGWQVSGAGRRDLSPPGKSLPVQDTKENLKTGPESLSGLLMTSELGLEGPGSVLGIPCAKVLAWMVPWKRLALQDHKEPPPASIRVSNADQGEGLTGCFSVGQLPGVCYLGRAQ